MPTEGLPGRETGKLYDGDKGRPTLGNERCAIGTEEDQEKGEESYLVGTNDDKLEGQESFMMEPKEVR